MITKDNNFKIMKLFFDNPEQKFHIREIGRKTGISSTGVIKIVKRLKKYHLLTSKKSKIMEEIGPDFKGRFHLLKRSYNMYNILDCGIVELLKDHYEQPKAIVLFGSYGEGTDTSKSDVDIAVITKKEAIPSIDEFEKKLKRKITVYPLHLLKASNEFKNSLANGIVLDGFLEIL